MEEFIKYAQGMGANVSVINWLNTTLQNYLEKNKPTITEVEHVIDYLVSKEIPRISQMSYPQAVVKSEGWTKALQKKAEGIQEKKGDVKVEHDFKDGFKIVRLIGENAYKREGNLMRNCVASYFGRDTKIYSLRDKQNEPHCTMEWGQQIKGKGNGSIHPKYIKYVIKFLELTGMTVGDSEMQNLGYANVEKFKDDLSKENKLFNGKYWYKSDKLVGKDGNEFVSLDLLDLVPLIEKTTLKINFNLKTFIPLSLYFLFKKTKKTDEKIMASSGDSAQLASSGDSARLASSGDSARLDIKGKSGVGANIGIGGKIKGVLGTWITLAEYDSNGIVKYVKTGKIDGKKLKKNVWYQLKNKKFAEVKK